jgi:hypothetical protein
VALGEATHLWSLGLVITARVERTARQAQLAEWTERRAVIACELEWLYSQRLRPDVREQVRGMQCQLDGLDRRITTG